MKLQRWLGAFLCVGVFTLAPQVIEAKGMPVGAPSARVASVAVDLTTTSSTTVVLPWEEPPHHIYVCGNNNCPEVEECWWECAHTGGCDGVIDILNPYCWAWAEGCCLGCGQFSDSCYPEGGV